MNLAVQPKAQGRNPHTVFCYICGREFGSQSISIHEKTCLEKWDKEQAKLPKSQRRPRPVKPEISQLPNDSIPRNNGNESELKAQYNDLAFATYSEQSRVECPNCSRKFAQEDRLQVHLKSCKPGGYFEKKAAKGDDKSPVQAKPSTPSKAATPAKAKTNTPLQDIKKKANPSPLESKVSITKPTTNDKNGASAKEASFCSECGFHFKLSEKFCPDCGVKRLAI